MAAAVRSSPTPGVGRNIIIFVYNKGGVWKITAQQFLKSEFKVSFLSFSLPSFLPFFLSFFLPFVLSFFKAKAKAKGSW